jgi:hypothetical protein
VDYRFRPSPPPADLQEGAALLGGDPDNPGARKRLRVGGPIGAGTRQRRINPSRSRGTSCEGWRGCPGRYGRNLQPRIADTTPVAPEDRRRRRGRRARLKTCSRTGRRSTSHRERHHPRRGRCPHPARSHPRAGHSRNSDAGTLPVAPADVGGQRPHGRRRRPGRCRARAAPGKGRAPPQSAP